VKRVAFLALATVAGLGCEAVPDLTFATAPSGDGGAGQIGDGDCTSGLPPDAANACCGQIPCSGDCNPVSCDTCQNDCNDPGMICCAKQRNVVCHPIGTPCQ
jgi:hypothetical protein